MTTATKALKIKAALRQIAELRTERDRIADSWLTIGKEKAFEATDALGEQIVRLYEEIDALEAGETKVAGMFRVQQHDDEIGCSRAELALVAHLGWTAEDVIRNKRKNMRRRVAG
jgi:hypothetical protein